MRQLVSSCVLIAALGAAWDVRASTDSPAATDAPAVSGVQLPNDAILGRPTSGPILLLREKLPGDAEPVFVLTDVRCGRYSGMTARYPRDVSEVAVKKAVGALYGDEKMRNVWRVEPQQFSVMVGIEREGFDKGSVHVIFNRFLGPTADPCSAFEDEPAKR
jgi:hypothetical protein